MFDENESISGICSVDGQDYLFESCFKNGELPIWFIGGSDLDDIVGKIFEEENFPSFIENNNEKFEGHLDWARLLTKEEECRQNRLRRKNIVFRKKINKKIKYETYRVKISDKKKHKHDENGRFIKYTKDFLTIEELSKLNDEMEIKS